MYVAITRAKKMLYLTRSKSRYLYGRREPTLRSRFVEELKDLLDLPELPRARFTGDYGYEGGYRDGYGYAAKRRGWLGFGRRTEELPSNPVRAKERPSQFPTFGAGKPPVRKEPAKKSPPTIQLNRTIPAFAVGMKVRHTRFGVGEIVAMRGQESNLIVTVCFETAGNKDLAAALAPLEIVT